MNFMKASKKKSEDKPKEEKKLSLFDFLNNINEGSQAKNLLANTPAYVEESNPDSEDKFDIERLK